MEKSTNTQLRPRYWHCWIGLLLCLALVPVLRSQGLPLKLDWITLGIAFWFLLTAESIFVAVLLSLIGLPEERVARPFLTRCRQNPLRCVALLFFFVILGWLTTWPKALVVGVDVVALLELYDRQGKKGLRNAAASVFAPATYLFLGFLMVLAYNYVIVSVRFNFVTDPAFAAIDRWLLMGHSVSEFAHWSVQTFSLSFFRVLEFIYFGMFPQIGAALILVALCDGRTQALQFVGAILVSYYIALAMFYIWPSQGPYYLCPAHFSRFPSSLQVYHLQKTLIRDALALWQHRPISRISTDYFIAFPCMHIAQPMVVIWFLRRWRRIVLALAIYDSLLILAVLMLEQHYVIDVIAGFLVAGFAIAISGSPFHRRNIEPATTQAGGTA